MKLENIQIIVSVLYIYIYIHIYINIYIFLFKINSFRDVFGIYGSTKYLEQGKSEGFDSCDRPSLVILLKIGFKSSICLVLARIVWKFDG